MAIHIDTSQPIRTPSRRVELIDAVVAADASDPEPDWLEWKCPPDLTTADMRFNVAKTVLGMGNRDPARSSLHVGGDAFLVLGAEPGAARPFPKYDPADIENWLGAYVGRGTDGPRWDMHYVPTTSGSVLLIVVSAPQQGDPIFTLQKGFGTAPAGRIFVRRNGKTEEASPQEINMLTRRAAAASKTLNLAVDVVEQTTIPMFTLSKLVHDGWIDDERERLEPRTGVGPIYIARDSRGLPKYRKEVDEYLEKLRQAGNVIAAARAIRRRLDLGRLQFAVTNLGDDNFSSVELQVSLPDLIVGLSEEDGEEVERMAKPPRIYGDMSWMYRINAPLIPPAPMPNPDVHIDRTGATDLAVFRLGLLRPRATVRSDLVFVFARPDWRGKEARLSWSATSSSVSGVASGTLALPVDEERVLDEVLLVNEEDLEDADDDD
ncbi:MAG: hypothetical protein WAT66_00635 [Actinomycetota bacterium]